MGRNERPRRSANETQQSNQHENLETGSKLCKLRTQASNVNLIEKTFSAEFGPHSSNWKMIA